MCLTLANHYGTYESRYTTTHDGFDFVLECKECKESDELSPWTWSGDIARGAEVHNRFHKTRNVLKAGQVPHDPWML